MIKIITSPGEVFFVIDDCQVADFAKTYFKDNSAGDLNPKILVVQPGKRLSWQNHHRRAEIWQVLTGPVGVIRSDTDEESLLETFTKGDPIRLKQGERHRLVGLNDWGVLAEIWQHTDAANPSDEGDIIRFQDDFGR